MKITEGIKRKLRKIENQWFVKVWGARALNRWKYLFKKTTLICIIFANKHKWMHLIKIAYNYRLFLFSQQAKKLFWTTLRMRNCCLSILSHEDPVRPHHLIPKRHSTFKVSWTALPVWVQNDEGCLISWCDSFLSVNQPEGVPGWPNSLLEHAMNDGKVHVITASSSESLLIHATLRLHWLSNESVVAPRSDLSWSQKGWCPGLCIIRLSITVLTWL